MGYGLSSDPSPSIKTDSLSMLISVDILMDGRQGYRPTRQTIYRIRDDRAGAEAALKEWNM